MKKLIFDIQENKSRFVNIRLTQEDYKSIFVLAQKNKVSMSEVIRAIIRNYFSQKTNKK